MRAMRSLISVLVFTGLAVGCKTTQRDLPAAEPATPPAATRPLPAEPPAAAPASAQPASPATPPTSAIAPATPPSGTSSIGAPAALAPALLDPSLATERAPARYSVRLETTKGEILIDVDRSWAPLGADRFYNLVKIGYFTDVACFRVIAGFMAQIGIHGDPRVNAAWRRARVDDDPVRESNTRGMVTFATSGPNSRTTQFFVSFGNNAQLDGIGFAPFGRVRDMQAVDALYSGYGEGAPSGRGPSQSRLQGEGNSYLRAEFPELDWIRSARIVER